MSEVSATYFAEAAASNTNITLNTGIKLNGIVPAVTALAMLQAGRPKPARVRCVADTHLPSPFALAQSSGRQQPDPGNRLFKVVEIGVVPPPQQQHLAIALDGRHYALVPAVFLAFACQNNRADPNV